MHHGCKECGEYVLISLEGKNVTTYCTACMNGGACTCPGTTSNSKHLRHNASTANQVRPSRTRACGAVHNDISWRREGLHYHLHEGPGLLTRPPPRITSIHGDIVSATKVLKDVILPNIDAHNVMRRHTSELKRWRLLSHNK